MHRLSTLKLLIISILTILASCSFKQAPYAAWAHSHWVWYNGARQDQANLKEMVDTYLKLGIPVGAVNIDSAWTTGFNNFQWNYTKFPDPKGFIQYMHSKNIKVIAWVTSMINVESNIYPEAKQKGYLLNEGQAVKWWHGHGAFLDYTNKEAVSWWHSLMDKVLDIGLDGWKCDGSDPLLILLKPYPYSKSKTRVVRYREYANHYYGDFYNYTRTRNPEGLIMSRPVDNLGNEYYFRYSPEYVMFSGWVGDQDSTYEGFQSAMKNIFHSAWKKYTNFGFDIGGYRGQNHTRECFIRYAQTGAMLPLMENGGGGNHFPWLYDQQIVQIYKKYAILHTELMPFFLTSGTEAYAKKKSVIHPLTPKRYRVDPTPLTNFGYILGGDILVYPVLNDAGVVNLDFPASNQEWVYYWNHTKTFNGKSHLDAVIPLEESPIFLRKGAIIGMQSHILIVSPDHLQTVNKTIYYSSYSDEVAVRVMSEGVDISVDRYFKVESIMAEDRYASKINVKVIVDEGWTIIGENANNNQITGQQGEPSLRMTLRRTNISI